METNSFGFIASANRSVELSSLWQALTTGQTLVGKCWYSADDCFMLLCRRHARDGHARLNPRRVEILERTLLGHSQKEIAIERDLAVSTVAFSCSESLRAMGIVNTASRVPAVLVMAAHAARGLPIQPGQVLPETLSRDSFVLSVPRPDRVLDQSLSAAERDVTRHLVEGLNYGQIAARRRTAMRTVANQLRSVFSKLRISGRNELVCMLVATLGTQPSSARAVAQ